MTAVKPGPWQTNRALLRELAPRWASEVPKPLCATSRPNRSSGGCILHSAFLLPEMDRAGPDLALRSHSDKMMVCSCVSPGWSALIGVAGGRDLGGALQFRSALDIGYRWGKTESKRGRRRGSSFECRARHSETPGLNSNLPVCRDAFELGYPFNQTEMDRSS